MFMKTDVDELKMLFMALVTRGIIGARSRLTARTAPIMTKLGIVTISSPVNPIVKSGRKMYRFLSVYVIVSFFSSSTMFSRSFHSLNENIIYPWSKYQILWVNLLEHVRTNFMYNRLRSIHHFIWIRYIEKINFEDQWEWNFFKQRSHLRSRLEAEILS